MPSLSRRSASLATQISMSTLGLVTLAVLLASVLALGGVYSMARQETSARLQTLRDILLDDVDARFVVADRVLDSAATGVLAAADETAARETIVRLAAANTEYFDVMLFADAQGDVLTAWPPGAVSADVAGTVHFEAGRESAESILVWEAPEDPDESGRVWITVHIPGSEDEDRRVLAARLRLGFVGLLVGEITSKEDGRVALVVDDTGALIEAGEGAGDIDTARVEWSADEDSVGVGSVSLRDATLGDLTGFYADVTAAADLGWRVVVLEPHDIALQRTQAALLPASLTISVTAVVAMWAAFAFGRRVAEPLTVLERRAREVASGAYIQPIEVERDDEVGRLASAFNAMAARLNALQDLSQLLASASDLDQVLDGILSSMEHIMGTGREAIFLLDEEGRFLDLVKASGIGERSPELSVPVSGPGWVSQAFRSGKSVSFIAQAKDTADDPVLRIFASDAVASGLAVPLSIGRQPFGVVLVVSTESRHFTEAETEMARAFSAQAAVAVQSSRLFEEEHLSRTEAEALREMAELLAGPRSLRDTLDQVGTIAADLLEMADGYLAMTERDRRDLDIPPSEDEHVDRRYLELWEGVTRGDPERGPAEPVPVLGLGTDPHHSDLAKERGAETVMMIPMMQGGRERGVLVLESWDEERGFSLRDVEVAYATGKSVSVALEQNFLFHQARRRAENLEMVFRISQAVGLSLQTTVVLNRVMDVVQKMIPSAGVSLMQFNPRRGVLTTAMARGVEDKRVLLAEVAAGEDVPGEAFESRRPVTVDDIDRIDTPLGRLLYTQGFKSWLCAPLLARGKSIGVLSAFAKEPSAFTEEDAELVSTFAAQAALALDTAALFEKEHTIASVLQSSLVPDVLPTIEGMRTASTYQPAGSESEIGGDYYDLLFASDGRLVLAIGDVCGKGVQAATKTSVIKYTLRGLVTAGLGPSSVLRELNRVVAETGDIADIVTMWIGYLDRDTGRLTYASAGHPPALLRERDGEIVELGPTGPLLGAIDAARFSKKATTLEPGSTIVLYTDGVTEARSSQGLFGEARLKEVLAHVRSPEQMIECVLEAIRGFTDGVFRDDVAMLAAEYLPEPEAPEDEPE